MITPVPIRHAPQHPSVDTEHQLPCRGEDPKIFFPAGGDQDSASAGARAACARCAIRDECLEWALGVADLYGIWGGRTARERRGIRSGRLRTPRSWHA